MSLGTPENSAIQKLSIIIIIIIIMFVVWNVYAAPQKFDVLNVRVQESIENRGATLTQFNHRRAEHRFR